MQVQSQFINEEGIPIRQSELQIKQQFQFPQNIIYQKNQISSIPVYEKTRLPPDSNVYKKYSQIIGFHAVNIDWDNHVRAQQIQSQQISQPQPQSQQQIQQNPQVQTKSQIHFKNLKQTPSHRISETLQCPWCNCETNSDIEFKIGIPTIALCLLGSFMIIGPIVLCLDGFKDCYHYCRNCGCEIGVVRFCDC